MTIALALNLADGLILGTDSAITIYGSAGQAPHVYTDADKLFTLWDTPVAVATWGMATLGSRTIRSYLREFEQANTELRDSKPSVSDIARALYDFMHDRYVGIAKSLGIQLLPVEQRGALGLLLGGFSPGEHQSEVWEIRVEQDDASVGVQQAFAPGHLNVRWRGMTDGVVRFHLGMVWEEFVPILALVVNRLQIPLPLDQALLDDIRKELLKQEFAVQLYGMPLQEGVDYVRFLLDMMINESRFVRGKTGCGGKVRMIVVQADKVTWVTDSSFRMTH